MLPAFVIRKIFVLWLALRGARSLGTSTRRAVLGSLALAPVAAKGDVGDILDAAKRNSEKTYSNNARNIQRIQQGDYSQGAKQTSTSERGLRRRAALACKSPKALKASNYDSEADCTRAVLAGEGTQIMLDALDNLGDDCKVDPTHVCL